MPRAQPGAGSVSVALLALLLALPARAAGPDCNLNGNRDRDDIAAGTSRDCNGNGVPDECDTAVTFAPHVVSESGLGQNVGTGVDLDGDLDTDLLVAYNGSHDLVWYENSGSGEFSSSKLIADLGPTSVVALDLDGDGDADVFSTGEYQLPVAWHENLDGSGTRWATHGLEPTGVGLPVSSAFGTDVDVDGDVDVLVTLPGPDTIAWYENTDGRGTFVKRTVFQGATDVQDVLATDLDSDGDPDVVSAASGGEKVAWYENTDGQGAFGPEQVISPLGDAVALAAADLDSDGDVDLVAACTQEGLIAWYENTDGLGHFGTQQKIASTSVFVEFVHAVDLDGDGDADILTRSATGPTLVWIENLGGDPPAFLERHLGIPGFSDWPTSAFAADLDGDGDVDVLSTAQSDVRVAWYENESDDCNADGVPHECEPDCNANGVSDACEADCDGNGVADACDIAGGAGDCDGNGVPDACEDCNRNGLADACDIAAGTSADCDRDGVADDCEPDCNGNGVADDCDVARATSGDCNANGVPDTCDIGGGASADCDLDAVPDECQDCNGNGVGDACDLSGGTSVDCDQGGVPDECEDCNGNGVGDACDLLGGTSVDCDANGLPDTCDTRPSYTDHAISFAAEGANDVVAADLDGDGDPDVVSSSGDRVAWYENTDGLGSFGLQTVIELGLGYPQSVFAADLDGDADLDVLASYTLETDGVQWFENLDGHGTFGPPREVASGSSLAAIAADLDGDGDLDVAASFNPPGSGPDRIYWFENLDGLGTFSPAHVLPDDFEDTSWSLFAADLDSDGDQDLLSATPFSQHELAWHENVDGLGTFAPRVVLEPATGVSVVAADLDGDADLDVVGAEVGNDAIAWFENLDGAATFGPARIVSAEAVDPRGVFAQDMDADGDVDVVSANEGEDAIAWYENADGAGTFGVKRLISLHVIDAAAVVAADLDADGDIDAVSASPDETILWHENESDDCNVNGIPDVCEPNCNGNGIADACDLVMGSSADCNGNASPDECDIAVGTSLDCSSDGVPDECEPDCNGNAEADSCDIFAGTSIDCDANGVPDECEPDCDANGTTDACEPDCNANDVPDACDLGTGASSDCDGNGVPDECDTAVGFVPHVISGTADTARAVFAADLDLDGDLDALSASAGDGKIAWYPNLDGAGNFGVEAPITLAAAGARSVVAADLDGDLDSDVLSASSTDATIAWYENTDGAGGFGPQLVISANALSARTVHAADLDGDADLDVLSASAGDHKVAWYENTDGAGAFGDEQVISTSSLGSRAALAADLDGDGDADVLSATVVGVFWFENTDGAGAFSGEQPIAVVQNTESTAAADLDGDADLDVLYASTSLGTVVWLANDGTGSFGSGGVLDDSAAGARSVFAADLDGDADRDVLVAVTDDDEIVWYENTDGAGSFGPGQVVTARALGAWAAIAADMDGDGDTDALSASRDDDTIAWHENGSDDCNGNEIPDACEPDCDTSGVPDACESACAPACDDDGDLCADDLDCAPADPAVWAEPEPARSLTLSGGRATTLSWQAPVKPGAVSVTYDLLRSPVPSDFIGEGSCLGAGLTETAAVDAETPAAGELFYYLVRVDNGCPGAGSMGSDSAGLPHTGPPCTAY